MVKYENEDESLRNWVYSTEQCILLDKEFILNNEYKYTSLIIAPQVSNHLGIQVTQKNIEKIFHFIDDNKDSMEKEKVIFNAFKEQQLDMVPIEDMMYIFERYNKCVV